MSYIFEQSVILGDWLHFVIDFLRSASCLWDSSKLLWLSIVCSLNGWEVSHCMKVPQLVYPCPYWRTFSLFPFFWGVWVILNRVVISIHLQDIEGTRLHSAKVNIRSVISWSCGWVYVFSSVRNGQDTFWHGCSILHSQQQCTKHPFVPCPTST